MGRVVCCRLLYFAGNFAGSSSTPVTDPVAQLDLALVAAGVANGSGLSRQSMGQIGNGHPQAFSVERPAIHCRSRKANGSADHERRAGSGPTDPSDCLAAPSHSRTHADVEVHHLSGFRHPCDAVGSVDYRRPDVAKAKDILGRTATLELRLMDESAEGQAAESGSGSVPFGSERYLERNGRAVIVKKQVILTGENLTDAQAGIDTQNQGATVNLTLDAKGSRIFQDVTRENINKRMAIILFEKGKGEVVTAPVIRTEIGGGRVQISGSMNTSEAVSYTHLTLPTSDLV